MAAQKKRTHAGKQKGPQEEKLLEKQQVKDLGHKMNLNLNSFLVLREEGNPHQLALASQKAKSDLLKYGPDMYRLAQDIGGSLPSAVENYINSISAILHSAFGWIDEAIIHDYYIASQRLAHEIHL
jgi:hypothetical protein